MSEQPRHVYPKHQAPAGVGSECPGMLGVGFINGRIGDSPHGILLDGAPKRSRASIDVWIFLSHMAGLEHLLGVLGCVGPGKV